MARYIDADKLLEQVNSLEQLARKRVYDTPTNSPAYDRYATQYQEREKMLAILKAQPAADVAPRAEVAREIFEEIRDLIRFTMEPNSTILYAKIEFEKLKELKNKYTDATDICVGRK